MKQWAKIVIALERAVTQSKAKEHLLSYSVKLSAGNDGENGASPAQEVRGVMVIKSIWFELHSKLAKTDKCQSFDF